MTIGASPAASDTAWIGRLLAWYRLHRRTMPWRDDPRPYPVWLSEIMLQQTQVDTVIPYFARFLTAFPTVQALAAADAQAVLKQWEGLGYYSRARNLHACAKAIVADHGGEVPGDFATLLTLPGLGPYTAAAVASIAFGQPVPVVDGNVLRVVTRFRGWHDGIAKPKTRDKVFAHLEPAIVASGAPSDFNQAVMELGALVCRPVATPACAVCPLQPDCVAARDGLTDRLPVKAPRQKVPHHDLAAAVIWRGDRLLLAQRPADGMLGGLWMFPTGRLGGSTAETGNEKAGKAAKGETAGKPGTRSPARRGALGGGAAAAGAVAARAAWRQAAQRVAPGHVVAQVDHAYSHFTIRLTAIQCRLVDRGEASADGMTEEMTGELADAPPSAADVFPGAVDRPATLAWATLDEIAHLPLDKATQHIVAALRDLALFHPAPDA